MDRRDYLNRLVDQYTKTHPRSHDHFRHAAQVLPGGGSHNLRLFSPFPFYEVGATGAQITDLDGHTYTDFWQGHLANILGHNPEPVIRALRQELEAGRGLATGFPGRHQAELAELILDRIHAQQIRFTTSGALATMNAMLLARAFTGRKLVIKIAGGWHGAHPFALKGVHSYRGGLGQLESAGLPDCADSEVIVTRFNDLDDLERVFSQYGADAACFIVEPMLGSGGAIFADPEYLTRARELTEKHGAVLILDEVITAFRFHPGAVAELYAVEPDLFVLGKAVGGGMPVAAVAGRADIMALAAPGVPHGTAVKFDGGTFSAHPQAMIAGAAFLRHLVERADEIYPYLGALGRMAREGIEQRLGAYNIPARAAGDGGAVSSHSSIVAVHILTEGSDRARDAEQVYDPARSDVELRDVILKLAMLNEGFFIVHGYGALSTAHTEHDVARSLDAMERIAAALGN